MPLLTQQEEPCSEFISVLPVEDVFPDPTNPRTGRPDDGIPALGISMKEIGQQMPITVRPNAPDASGRKTFTVLHGHRRLLAKKHAGAQTIRAIVTQLPLSDKVILLAQLAENRAREDLLPVQHVDGLCRALDLHPELTAKTIADKTGYSESEVSKAKTIKGCPVAYAALADGRLKILKAAYTVAKADSDQKIGLLNLLMTGTTCEEAAKTIRKPRQQGEKVTRLAISLPGGISITLAGKEMDLEQTIEHLAECLKAARKARDEGLSAKSWSAGMRDRAGKP